MSVTKTRTKPITYLLDFSNPYKTKTAQNQSNYQITYYTRWKTTQKKVIADAGVVV